MSNLTHFEKAIRFINNIDKLRRPGDPETRIELNRQSIEFDQVKFFIRFINGEQGHRTLELIIFADGGWRLIV